jgi:uncharacterized protein (DUF1697 family)
MVEYVALLRGINVGGHKKVNMEDLRQAFTSWGFQSVKTVLATGNVVFESPVTDPDTLASTIEDKIKAIFGLDVSVILRRSQEIQELVNASPFEGITVTPQTRLYVTFLSEKPNSHLEIPYGSPEKDFRILRVSEREVCSVLTLSPNSRSTKAMDILEKEFGKNVTTRNWNTVIKIAQLSA